MNTHTHTHAGEQRNVRMDESNCGLKKYSLFGKTTVGKEIEGTQRAVRSSRCWMDSFRSVVTSNLSFSNLQSCANSEIQRCLCLLSPGL